MPGLDGLRALAVIAVLGYHFAIPQMGGGLLGVSIFFTLSGFLITGILVSTWERTGGLELRRFWLHRARRLLPALVVVLVVVLTVTAITDAAALSKRWSEAVSALFYVNNWATISGGGSYFDYFAGPRPLEHLWSLSIEEQFYLVWPLLLLLLMWRFSGRLVDVAKITIGLAAASFIAMAILAQPALDNTRAYEGTDTRAGELLIGAALALIYRPSRVRARPPIGARILVDTVGIAALFVMLWMVVSTSFYSLSLYRGGFLLLAVATALVVAVVSYPGSLLGSAFAVPPLRWVGERSYGIYLWHMPVVAFTPPSLLKGVSVPLVVLQVTLTFALAALSWRLIENPIRQHGFIDALRRPVASTSLLAPTPPTPTRGGLVLTAAAVVALTSCSFIVKPDDGIGTDSMASADGAPLPPAQSDGDRNHHADKADPSRSDDSGDTEHRSDSQQSDTQQQTDDGGSMSWETSCDSVVHVGDSTSIGLMDPAYGLRPRQRIDAQYHKVGVENVDTDILGARSIVEHYHDQPNAQEATAARMDDGYDGCWVFAMGTNEVANQAVGGVTPLDERIDLLMNEIDGQPAMWLTVKTMLSSGPWANDEMEKWNDALRDACDRYPNLRVYDWASEVHDGWYIPDGIHFTTPGYAQRAKRTARALAVAYPFEGSPSSDCFVTSS
ncbi:MAG TPA: acyltransferase family protein [Nocardioidaceae bacterium]|nr:acyltransferase family protein [Nocardioidaceae bacterium]